MFHNGIRRKKNEIIYVLFEDADEPKIGLETNKNESFLSLIQRYINKTKKNNLNLSFVLDGKEINSSLLIGQSGIKNNDIITVIRNAQVIGGGGFGLNFTDLSKKITEEYQLSNQAPDYRRVSQGINICGECKYEKCEAYNKEVNVPLEGIRIFDRSEEHTSELQSR